MLGNADKFVLIEAFAIKASSIVFQLGVKFHGSSGKAGVKIHGNGVGKR